MVIDYAPITRYEYTPCHATDSSLLAIILTTCTAALCLFSPTFYCSTFVSVPSDFGGLSVDAYISGIIAGVLEGAGFPARVTAHSVALEEGESSPSSVTATLGGTTNLPPRAEKAVFLVKFSASVLARDS